MSASCATKTKDLSCIAGFGGASNDLIQLTPVILASLPSRPDGTLERTLMRRHQVLTRRSVEMLRGTRNEDDEIAGSCTPEMAQNEHHRSEIGKGVSRLILVFIQNFIFTFSRVLSRFLPESGQEVHSRQVHLKLSTTAYCWLGFQPILGRAGYRLAVGLGTGWPSQSNRIFDLNYKYERLRQQPVLLLDLLCSIKYILDPFRRSRCRLSRRFHGPSPPAGW